MNVKKMIVAAMAAVLTGLLGTAQIHAQSGGFTFFGPLGRVITPNGDGLNDRLFISFDNFSDSGVTARVYSLLGADVASMSHVRSPLPGGAFPQQHVTWDGRASNGTVSSGMYVYRVESEGKAHVGTFLVVR